MTDFHDPLLWQRRRVSETIAKVRSVISGMEALEADIEVESKPGSGVRHCIDFFDLYGYLTLHEKELTGPMFGASDGYARLLLLSGGDPVLILPSYFRELRNKLEQVVGRLTREAIGKVVGEVRPVMSEVLRRPGGLLVYLRECDRRQTSQDRPTVRRLAQELLDDLRAIGVELTKINRARIIALRFKRLNDSGRVIGLPSILGSRTIELRNDDVFQFARQRLDSLRLPGKSESNKIDAAAIATVAAFNRSRAPLDPLLILTSSAATMRTVVDLVNVRLLQPRREEVALRDLNYWRLRFALAQRLGLDSATPQAISPFVRSTEQSLRQVLARALRIRDRLNGRGQFSQSLVDEVVVLTGDIDQVVDGVFELQTGTASVIASIDDLVMPLDTDGEIASSIKRLETMLTAVASEVGSVDEVAADLAALLDRLLRLFLKVEADLARVHEETGLIEFAFGRGWVLGIGDLGPEFVAMLNELEAKGTDAAALVMEQLAMFKDEPDRRYGTGVVLARVLLLLGRVAEARDEIDALRREGAALGPSAAFTDALVLREEGDAGGAEAVLNRLLNEYDDAVVRSLLAELLRSRYLRTRDPKPLRLALEHAKVAVEQADLATPSVKASCRTILYDIRLDVDETRDWIPGAILDLGQFRHCLAGSSAERLEAVVGRLALSSPSSGSRL